MTITIIGGGIIGLTTAFELTERGENVHLIDAETSDYGTTDDCPAIRTTGVAGIAMVRAFVDNPALQA